MSSQQTYLNNSIAKLTLSPYQHLSATRSQHSVVSLASDPVRETCKMSHKGAVSKNVEHDRTKAVPNVEKSKKGDEVKLELQTHARQYPHGPAELSAGKLTKVSTRSSDYVYVNDAYVGSVNSVNARGAPPSSVMREQYWACSKWPVAQRILALAVGVLCGAVLGLIVSLILKGGQDNADNVFDNLFRARPAPD